MLSAPTSTAPAASKRSIRVAWRDAGLRSRLIFEPARVLIPFTSNRFFTAKGTPASGPGFFPADIAASTSRAFARARSAVTSVKELRRPSCLAIRASASSVACSAESLRVVTALAISEADRIGAVMARSGDKDTGGLGLVGQRKLVDQSGEPQRYFEVRPHRGPPGVLDSQRQRFRDGGDVVVDCISSHFAPVSRFLSDRQRRMRDRRQQLLCIGILRIAKHGFGRAL